MKSKWIALLLSVSVLFGSQAHAMTVIQSTKISTAVSAVTNTAGTVYTAPASSYAILNISAYSSTSFRVTVGSGTVLASATATTDTTRQSIVVYVGPGQAVAWVKSGTAGIDVSGVEFVNS